MAGLAGFEPAVHWIKTRCLTAWLQPCIIAVVKDRCVLSIYFSEVQEKIEQVCKKIMELSAT